MLRMAWYGRMHSSDAQGVLVPLSLARPEHGGILSLSAGSLAGKHDDSLNASPFLRSATTAKPISTELVIHK